LFELLVDRVHLRQAEGGDEGADQARAGQVDAFGEGAAEHREADALAVGLEAFQEGVAGGFVHAPVLGPDGEVRVALAQGGEGLVQVVVAAEEGQVVAGPLAVLVGDKVGDGDQRGRAVAEAGGDAARHAHLQLVGLERRRHFAPGGVVRQAEQVGVVTRRAQGGGEQHRAAGAFKARAQ